MKKIAALLSLNFVFFFSSADAVTWYWDTTAGAGNGVGGTGSLTSTSATWSTTATGDSSLTAGTSTTIAVNDLVFQGTAGTVSLGASVAQNSVTFNTTGYTISVSGTTSNRYFNSTNGITLGDGVTLNLTAAAVAYNAGTLGIMGPITNAAGASGYGTIAITGNSGTTAGAGIRVGSRTTNAGSGVLDWWANLNIKTTGNNGAILHTMDASSTNRIRGNIVIDSGSKLTLSPGGNSTRTISVYGTITTSASNALAIGELTATTTNLGCVDLRNSNTITGDLNVYGQLGYRNLNALGSARVVMLEGSAFGQSGSMGTDTPAERTITNLISIQGSSVSIGGLPQNATTYGAYLGGNIDLSGGTRTVNMQNSAYITGAVTNGSLVFTNSSASRTWTQVGDLSITNLTLVSVGTSLLNGNNKISNVVVSNGIVVMGQGTQNISSYTVYKGSLSASGLGNGTPSLTLQGIGGTAVFSNTAVSGQTLTVPTLNLNGSNSFSMSTAGSLSVSSPNPIVLSGGSNNISLTGSLISSGTTYTLFTAPSINKTGLTEPVTLTGAGVNNAPGLVLDGPSITSGVNIYTFRSTSTSLELRVDPNLALNLSWNGGNSGNWNTDPANTNWSDAGTPAAFSIGNNALIDTTSNAVSLNLDATGITAGYVTVSGGNNAATLSGGALTAISLAATGSDLVVDSFCTLTNLSVTNANISGSGTITTKAGATVQSDLANTFSVQVAGVGGFTKTGVGILTLSAQGIYSGDTTVSSGTLITSGAELIPDASTLRLTASGSTFQLGGNESLAAVISATGSILELAGFNLTLGGTGLSFTNSATVSGSGKVIKNGAGLMYLNNGNNTFSGGLTVNEGEVAFTTSGNYGADGVVTNSVFGTGPLTVNGGTVRSSSDTSGRNIANDIMINGNMAFGSAGAAATITVNATALKTTTLTSDARVTNIAAVTWEQSINGPSFRLTKAGGFLTNSAGTTNLISFRASNNIGGMTLEGGIVGYKNRNAFGTGVLILKDGVTVGQDGTINNSPLSNNDQADRAVPNDVRLDGNVIFGLGGTANHFGGNLDLNGATRTISLGNTTYLYGQITNGGVVLDNGTGSGTRTLALFGANTFSGGTVVRTNAALAVGHDQALGGGNLIFTNVGASGVATLRASTLATNANQLRTIANAIQLDSGMVVTLDAVTGAQGAIGTNIPVMIDMVLAGNITGSGGLTKSASNTVTLTGNNSYSGPTSVTNGTLVVVKSNLTANITASSMAVTFSNSPVNGTYAILAGSLTGSYTPDVSNLPSDKKATFNGSSPASVIITNKATQSITGLVATDTKTTADTAYALSVTPGASTGSLTFSSDNPAVATVSSAGVVTIVGAGTTTLRVNQPGDADYLAAAEVTQILTVTSAGPTFESAYPGINLADVAPNGLTYLLNYAFGGSSTNQAKLPVQDTSDPTKLKLVAYVRTNNTAGIITVKGQTGSSLSSWDASLIDGVAAGDQSDAPAGTQKQIFSVPNTGDRLFLRLKVTK